MSRQIAFDDVLDAAEQLDVESQKELADVLNRRLAERGRQRAAQSRLEFASGLCNR